MPTEMPQAQHIVAVELIGGRTSRAIATGGNAAWICVCGRPEPLLGRAGALTGVSSGTRVDCPGCGRKYFVVPIGEDRGRVAKVVEVQ
jgi:hypothetical protein